MAFLATENPPSAFRSAGWTPSDLKEVTDEYDAIPIIEKIYTKLLAQIQKGERLHDQKTFGPDCDPATNLCKTPMCTAGHLVNMCGEAGYKLKARYGFAEAARIIHLKNRPDAPVQNFGGIPQKFVMAYIQERAAEESQPKSKNKAAK